MSLKQKAVKGVSWNLIERFGLQAIKFVLAVILARLLTPADFGLIGMITVFFAVAQVFIQGGFGQAYIQKKEVTDLDASTVFYTNLVISVFLYGLLWLAAPAIAAFYDQPPLVKLTRVMGLVVVINAFNMIQVAQVTRAIDFKRKTKITLTSTLFSGAAGISAAYIGYGVWSLVIQQMANRLFTTAGFWVTSKWRPGLHFSVQSFKNLFSFGAWVLAAGIIRTVFDNIYILTIGKFFPAAQLGFYTKAKQFQRLSSQQLSGAVGQVAFPVLSRFQDDKDQLRNKARKFLTHTLAFTAPLLVILMVVAKPFVLILLTEKWAPMIPFLQILCIVGFLYPIHQINVQLLQAQGKSNLNFRIAVIKNSLRIINIAAMYRFGVVYIILGEVVCSFLALAVNTYYTKQLVNYGFWDQLKDIRQILVAAVVAGAFGYGISQASSHIYVQFMLGCSLTALCYIAFHYIFNRPFFFEILKLRENFVR